MSSNLKTKLVEYFVAMFVILLLTFLGNVFARYATIQNKLNELENVKNHTIKVSNIKYIYIKNKNYVMVGDTLILK